MKTLDQKINSLQPSESIEISRTESAWVTAERTGDGKWIKFVRHTATGFTVFRTTSFIQSI